MTIRTLVGVPGLGLGETLNQYIDVQGSPPLLPIHPEHEELFGRFPAVNPKGPNRAARRAAARRHR